jgi:hypothetical protein
MKEKKKCNKCGEEKKLCEYHKCKNFKSGFKNTCKKCISEKNKLPENQDKIKNARKKWAENNKEKIKEYKKRGYENNKDKILKKNAEWRKKNPEKNKELMKSYRDKNKEILKIKKNEYKEKNRDKVLESTRKWVKENYQRYLEKKREYSKSEIGLEKKRKNYHKNKEKNNHIIAWRRVLINTIKRLGTSKEGKTNELLGYSALELKEHIEKRFVSGMTWDNWGEWHIDHIIPVSNFDKSENIRIINSLDNLQPLWAKDNLKKSNKILK